MHVLIIALFYAMMAGSWNLLAGFTGQVSFAHAAFAGVGAYASGMLAVTFGLSPWLGVIAGTACAALLGLSLGRLCLRMGGIYLSLTTLGFSEILRLVIVNEDRWTRGTMGLQVPGLLPAHSKTGYYFLFLAATTVLFYAMRCLVRSETGLAYRAVLNDETAAAASGVDTASVRLSAFAMSSAAAGLAGALYGHYLMLITPDIPSLEQMFLVLAMAVAGGLGSVWGPVAGAFALQFLSESIRSYGQFHLLVFGVATLLIVIFAPSGLAGAFKRLGERP